MAWTQDKINEIYLKVLNLSAKDKAFRGELLSNPTAAIEKLTGETLPKNFRIKIIESDPTYSATLALPLMLSDSISDDDLAAVAGGVSYYTNGDCGAIVLK